MILQLGDVVPLKSGGPQMTVAQVMPGGALLCSWFQNNECKSGAFPAAALEKA